MAATNASKNVQKNVKAARIINVSSVSRAGHWILTGNAKQFAVIWPELKLNSAMMETRLNMMVAFSVRYSARKAAWTASMECAFYVKAIFNLFQEDVIQPAD